MGEGTPCVALLLCPWPCPSDRWVRITERVRAARTRKCQSLVGGNGAVLLFKTEKKQNKTKY